MSTSVIGEIRMFSFARAPVGWHVCDGSLLNISDHEKLFTLIGITYGGDGARTFGLPDLRGRVPLQQGQGVSLSARPLGANGGIETVVLQATEAAHGHPLAVSTDLANQSAPKGNVLASSGANDKLYVEAAAVASQRAVSTKTMTDSYGKGGAHDNVMPTLTITYCICTDEDGIFPSRGD